MILFLGAAVGFSFLARTGHAKRDRGLKEFCLDWQEPAFSFLDRTADDAHYDELREEGQLHHHVIYTSEDKAEMEYRKSYKDGKKDLLLYSTLADEEEKTERYEEVLEDTADPSKYMNRKRVSISETASWIKRPDKLEKRLVKAVVNTVKRMDKYMLETNDRVDFRIPYNVCLAIKALPATEVVVTNRRKSFDFSSEPERFKIVLKTSFFWPMKSTKKGKHVIHEPGYHPLRTAFPKSKKNPCRVRQALFLYKSAPASKFSDFGPAEFENEEKFSKAILNIVLPDCKH